MNHSVSFHQQNMRGGLIYIVLIKKDDCEVNRGKTSKPNIKDFLCLPLDTGNFSTRFSSDVEVYGKNFGIKTKAKY